MYFLDIYFFLKKYVCTFNIMIFNILFPHDVQEFDEPQEQNRLASWAVPVATATAVEFIEVTAWAELTSEWRAANRNMLCAESSWTHLNKQTSFSNFINIQAADSS